MKDTHIENKKETENKKDKETKQQKQHIEKTSAQTDEKTQKENNEMKNKQESTQNETTENTQEKDQVTELQEKNNELNDKYLRLFSEFDNFRKRTQKEKADLYKTAGEDVIKALLPILDDFERAMKAMDDNNDPESAKEGFKLIYNKLINTLKNKGLEPMDDATGKEFNVEEHEAITRVPAPSEDLKGKIIDQVERGYKLNGKVIRYAKVVVGQ